MNAPSVGLGLPLAMGLPPAFGLPISSHQGIVLSGFLLAGGAALLARGLVPFFISGAPVARFQRYESYLQRELIFVRAGFTPRQLIIAQLSLVLGAVALAVKTPLLGLAPLTLAAAAPLLLKNARQKRTLQLEKQVEGWLTSVARSLEAAPSLGEALEASIATCDAPMREEIEQLDNEIRLGRPIDQALSQWSERVGSRILTMAVATLLVGRETGGQLGEVLRSAAASLREMERLEGVVRTKTAEGKGQAWVISIVPFPLYLGVKASDPTFFLPLEQTATGHLLLGIAAALWIGAILSARKILAVQI